MAETSLKQLLAEARHAYQERDRHNGARLIDEILRRDFDYPGAWELLYRLYGTGQPFEEFRSWFTAQFYPEHLEHLQSQVDGSSVSPEPKKRFSFLRRLFGKKRAESQPQLGEQLASENYEEELQANNQVQPGPIAEPISPLPTWKSRPDSQTGTGPPIQQPVDGVSNSVEGQTSTAIQSQASGEKTRVVLVDDIAQTRETVVRTLRFHGDIEVVGTASNGIQAIKLVRELKPDVVLMDVNMPDMDGITATATIKRDLPATEIVILTVQDDLDYMRRAMLAGARDFLSKPPMIDELINAVQRAGKYSRQYRLDHPEIQSSLVYPSGPNRGKIISVYSPRGGSGCTMLTVNLAIGLHRGDTPAVMIDGDFLFGDAPVHLNTQSKLSILDLAPHVDELDPEIVNSVLVEHSSGLRILHPPRPERAELVTGPQFYQLAKYLSGLYPFVVIDTAHRLSETTMAALNASDLIMLVSTLDIPSISRVRKFLELAPLLNLDTKLIELVINPYDPRVGIPLEKLPQAFGSDPIAIVPIAHQIVVDTINHGTPILTKRDTAQQPVGQALMGLVRHVRIRLRS